METQIITIYTQPLNEKNMRNISELKHIILINDYIEYLSRIHPLIFFLLKYRIKSFIFVKIANLYTVLNLFNRCHRLDIREPNRSDAQSAAGHKETERAGTYIQGAD